jgi:hypothetical protein
MSEENKPKEAAQNPTPELSPEELSLVSGGAVEIFLTLDAIPGESQKSDEEKKKRNPERP